MEYLTTDSLLEVISHLRPQVHLNAFACVASWLTRSINTLREVHSWKPGGKGRFAGIHQITPFQEECLKELFLNQHTNVPDMDNALIVCTGLKHYLQSEKCFARKIRIVDSTDCVVDNEYTIFISEYVLPVEEFTPLWTMTTGHNLHMGKEHIEVYIGMENMAISDLPLENMLQIDGVPLDSKLAYLKSDRGIRYKDLAPYDTFLCSPTPNIPRIASLLMQFSPTAKKLLIYGKNPFFGHAAFVLPAKKHYEYALAVHGMETTNAFFSIHNPLITRNMCLADYTLAACGYRTARATDYSQWLEKTTGETRDLSIFNPFNVLPDGRELWTLVDPYACWRDKVETLSTKALFHPLEAEQERDELLALKRQLEYSKSTTRGKKGTDALTLSEIKALCKSYALPQKGTRIDILDRLLEKVYHLLERL